MSSADESFPRWVGWLIVLVIVFGLGFQLVQYLAARSALRPFDEGRCEMQELREARDMANTSGLEERLDHALELCNEALHGELHRDELVRFSAVRDEVLERHRGEPTLPLVLRRWVEVNLFRHNLSRAERVLEDEVLPWAGENGFGALAEELLDEAIEASARSEPDNRLGRLVVDRICRDGQETFYSIGSRDGPSDRLLAEVGAHSAPGAGWAYGTIFRRIGGEAVEADSVQELAAVVCERPRKTVVEKCEYRSGFFGDGPIRSGLVRHEIRTELEVRCSRSGELLATRIFDHTPPPPCPASLRTNVLGEPIELPDGWSQAIPEEEVVAWLLEQEPDVRARCPGQDRRGAAR